MATPEHEIEAAGGLSAVDRSVGRLVDRLRKASTGYDEWRVQHPEDGSYCMAMSYSDSINPERELREWFDGKKASFPGWGADYVLAKVRVQTEEDMLMVEAACALERLRDAILTTLDENGHLADGDNCTLIHLVRAMETPNVEVSGLRRPYGEGRA